MQSILIIIVNVWLSCWNKSFPLVSKLYPKWVINRAPHNKIWFFCKWKIIDENFWANYFSPLTFSWSVSIENYCLLLILYIRVPCFCYEGLPLVAFLRFYCINLVYELISPLIDNTVQQATQMFIILLKTKKLRIVEDDIVNGLVQIPTRVQRPLQPVFAG